MNTHKNMKEDNKIKTLHNNKKKGRKKKKKKKSSLGVNGIP